VGEDFKVSVEREPLMGVWGLCPEWGPGVKGASPPEAEAFLLIPSHILKVPEFNFVLFVVKVTVANRRCCVNWYSFFQLQYDRPHCVT